MSKIIIRGTPNARRLNTGFFLWRSTLSTQEVCERALRRVQKRFEYYADMDITIIFLKERGDINKKHKELYGKPLYAPAFCSLSGNTIYISSKYATRFIIKHELGHLLFHRLLSGQRVSSELHECVAQWSEL